MTVKLLNGLRAAAACRSGRRFWGRRGVLIRFGFIQLAELPDAVDHRAEVNTIPAD